MSHAQNLYFVFTMFTILILPYTVHSVSKLVKMSHLNFRTLAFPQIVELVLTCLMTLFDRKLQLASLAMLNETFSMIFKHGGNSGKAK